MSGKHKKRWGPSLALARLRENASIIIHYFWKYRRLTSVGIVALIAVDLIEIIPPLLLKQTVDVVVSNEPLEVVALYAGAFLGIALLQSVCRFLWRMYLIRTSMMAGRDLRRSFARHLFQLSASFYDRKRVGDLMSLATNDTEAIRLALGPGLLVLLDALFLFCTVPVAMFILSPTLTLLSFIPLLCVPFIVTRSERLIHKRFRKVQASFGKLSAMAQENIMGIRTVKAFANEGSQIERFKRAGEEYIRLNLDLARVQSIFGPSLDFVMSLGLVLLLWIGGAGVIEGGITLGTFVAFQRYIQKMIWPMEALGYAVTFYQRAVASSDRLKAVLAEESDIREVEVTRAPHELSTGWRTSGKLEVRNLDFAFPGQDRAFLRSIDFQVEPGERLAVMGPIGSGKTALLSILPRIYPIESGKVRIDGIDINDWPLSELRDQIGFVSQDAFLFSLTVTENLALGLGDLLDEEEVRRRVRESAISAAVDEEIGILGDHYETQIGERGVNVSGGQRQRLTIARALAKDPAILILDDSLSSVDVATEEKILSGLRTRAQRNTEIIAAHRISTIREADQILVLSKGEIVQRGNHKKLIREAGLYRKYYEQQRLKEDYERYAQAQNDARA